MLVSIYRVCICEGGLDIINFSSFFVLGILCVKYLLEVCGNS